MHILPAEHGQDVWAEVGAGLVRGAEAGPSLAHEGQRSRLLVVRPVSQWEVS